MGICPNCKNTSFQIYRDEDGDYYAICRKCKCVVENDVVFFKKNIIRCDNCIHSHQVDCCACGEVLLYCDDTQMLYPLDKEFTKEDCVWFEKMDV